MRARNWPSWWLGAQDYLNSVMRKSPPTPKPILDPGVLVIAIAIPPSKANTPTTAIVDRLTLPRKRLDRSQVASLDAQRLRARLMLLAPLLSPAGSSRVFVQRI